MNNQVIKIWGAVAAGVLAISVVMPWITALGTSYSLMEGGDGPILLGSAALMAALAVWKHYALGVRLYGICVALFGGYESIHIYTNILDARDEAEGFGALVGIGIGLYVAGLAAAALMGWALYQIALDIKSRRDHRSQIVDGTWVREGEIG